MSLFSRYIFGQAASALLLILLSLTGVIWIAVALKQLNLVTTQSQTAILVFKMTLLALPNLMALIAPIALLIATIHVLNRLNGDSELIVMTAGGAPVWSFAKPLLLLAFIASLAISYVNHVAMPWSLRQLRVYITQVRTDLISQVLQPGKFNAPERNLTIHIRERHQDGTLLGILIHDERKRTEMTSVLAERGRIVKDGKNAFLMLYDGQVMRQEGDKPTTVLEFDAYPVDLAQMEKKNKAITLRPRELYYSELLNPPAARGIKRSIKNLQKSANSIRRSTELKPDIRRKRLKDLRQGIKHLKKALGKYRSELHERFASPFYPFVFVMIAIAFVGQAQTNRQNRTKAVVIAFVSAAACRLFGLASMNLVTVSSQAVPLVYAIPIVAIVLATIVTHLKMRSRRPSQRSEGVKRFFSALLGKLLLLPGLHRLKFLQRSAADDEPLRQHGHSASNKATAAPMVSS